MRCLLNVFLIFNILSSTTSVGTTFVCTYVHNTKKVITPNLYVLGDSLSDDGSMANILTHDSYKFDNVNFQTPFYHNSCTDGNVAAQVAVESLGTTLIPAWDNRNHVVGNNYAVDGAQAGENNTLQYRFFLNHYSLANQTDYLLKQHKLKKTDDILIVIGGDDLIYAVEKKSKLEQDLVISNAITNEINSIETLINNGGQNFIIANPPDISKIPRFLNTSQAQTAAEISSRFNFSWKIAMHALGNIYHKTNIYPYDLYEKFNTLLTKAKSIGKNTTQASIKWNTLNLLLNEQPKYINNISAKTIDNDFFFDDVHPNKWAHKHVGMDLAHIFKEINLKD
ncbi:SGNH/GDSL hydrolase family protein [Spiroplasma endosymbiont of Nebria brevicollis]|uniref:SGNH/GDSL hydrolase family protein n=1 Tax=Spiroplasma endosymbiont of Nebria brevicollis TaxID=3066284 RepID=UPI00313E6136